MSAVFEKGDRVKVTIEGTVNRVLNFDGTQELRIDADGLDHFIYTDTANVEKVEPEVEVFAPGTLVRDRSIPHMRYAIGHGGYFSFTTNAWHPFTPDDVNDFTAATYERVEVS